MSVNEYDFEEKMRARYARECFYGLTEVVLPALASAGSAVGSAAAGAGSAIGSGLGAIGSGIGSAAGSIGSALGSAGSAIGGGLSSAAGELGTLGESALGAIGSAGSAIGDFLGSTASDVAGSLGLTSPATAATPAASAAAPVAGAGGGGAAAIAPATASLPAGSALDLTVPGATTAYNPALSAGATYGGEGAATTDAGVAGAQQTAAQLGLPISQIGVSGAPSLPGSTFGLGATPDAGMTTAQSLGIVQGGDAAATGGPYYGGSLGAPTAPYSDTGLGSLGPAQGGTKGFWDSSLGQFITKPTWSGAGDFVSQNPMAIASALGLGYNLMNQGNVKGLNALKAQEASMQNQAQALTNYLNTGTLPSGLQAGLDQATANAKQEIKSKYAALGMSGSTAEASDIAYQDVNKEAQKAQLEVQLMNSGISAETASSGLLKDIVGINQQQDTATGQAIANFAAALGGFMPVQMKTQQTTGA